MKKIQGLDQSRTFCFYLITSNSIEPYFFEWDEPNHDQQRQMLNTICSWAFVHGWEDPEYDFPTGKVVKMSQEIKKDAESLRKSFCSGNINSHKSLISSLYKRLSAIKDGELFFIYRIVYSFPSQRLRLKITNELSFINNGKSKEEADEWFDNNAATFFKEYKVNCYFHEKIGELERPKRVCRFCGKRMPDVKFEKVAHVVPESIGGNKNLVCYEECDECNAYFGKKIERNLCNWFNYRRSINQIKKKSGGVPKAYGRNYVVENGKVSIFPDKDITKEKEIKLIGADTVTLQGIYRAFCKIAIDLIETKYLEQLKTTIEWIRFGKPKSSRYPQIAQMAGLFKVDEPIVYIFTRKDGHDTDDAPLHICILRIFDMAFLYVLPHVNSRMFFHENYTKSIPTEAFKLLGFTGNWVWESYDTTEDRDPNLGIDLSNSEFVASDKKEKAPIEKLRKERKPKDSIDFIEPKISEADILKRNLESINFTRSNNIHSISGNIHVQTLVDMSRELPLFLRFNVVYQDIKNNTSLSNIIYSVQISPRVLRNQMKVFNDLSFSLNQELFAQILEILLEYLYKDILAEHSDFPYTREMLCVNNVREILSDMQLVIMKKGQELNAVQGRMIWHTGY